MRCGLIVVLLVCGCGARTGLLLPDAMVDAPPHADDAAPPPFDAGPCATVLRPAPAEIVLVLDASHSMDDPLATSPTTRWAALGEALATTLPPEDATLALGAVFFPTSGGADCDVSSALDVPVGTGHASAVLAAFSAHVPLGGTPTADTLRVALDALRARSGGAVAQAIVLATDGGPNCNPADAGEPWYGIAPEHCMEGGWDPHVCLDDARTIAVLGEARMDGIPTIVIGMAVVDPLLVDTLDRMAVAGGRARATSPRYTDVERPADLEAALTDVASHAAPCRFVPASLVDLASAEVRIDGVLVARDATNGWTPGPADTVDFAGTACTNARRAGAVVVAVTPCM